jgi:hypothetical protein
MLFKRRLAVWLEEVNDGGATSASIALWGDRNRSCCMCSSSDSGAGATRAADLPNIMARPDLPVHLPGPLVKLTTIQGVDMLGFLTSIAMAITLITPGQTAAKPDPREKPETAVTEAVRMLEASQYEAFLLAFVPPDEQARLGSTPAEKKAFAEAFGKSKAARLLSALKEVAAASPAFNAERTVATFTPKAPVPSGPPLTFVKIGSFWYLANK